MVNLRIPRDAEPGVYPGKIVFTGDGIERTVLVVVEIESEKPLFDVKVEIPATYRTVHPGEEVVSQITIYNLGRIGRVDVSIEYGIMDLSGNITIRRREILAVETQVSLVRTITIPKTVIPENYLFYAKVNYNGIIGTGSSMFTVVKKWKFSVPEFLRLFLVLIFITIVTIFTVRMIFKYLRKSI
jgi:uncharacterized membrane protein